MPLQILIHRKPSVEAEQPGEGVCLGAPIPLVRAPMPDAVEKYCDVMTIRWAGGWQSLSQ